MFFFNKKRIYIMAFFIFASTLFMSMHEANLESKKTIETVSLPVSRKVIVIDAGHGKPDERSIK